MSNRGAAFYALVLCAVFAAAGACAQSNGPAGQGVDGGSAGSVARPVTAPRSVLLVEVADITTGVPRCGVVGPRYVTVRYRVIRVVRGAPVEASHIVVAQFCPAVPFERTPGRARPQNWEGMWWGDRVMLEVTPLPATTEATVRRIEGVPLVDRVRQGGESLWIAQE